MAMEGHVRYPGHLNKRRERKAVAREEQAKHSGPLKQEWRVGSGGLEEPHEALRATEIRVESRKWWPERGKLNTQGH